MNTGLPDGIDVSSLVFDPRTPRTLYAASGAYQEHGRRGSWNAAAPSTVPALPLPRHALVINPRTPGTLYAATGTGVFKSTDAVATWGAWRMPG